MTTRPPRLLATLVPALLASLTLASAAEGPDFAEFRIISERNIFNTERSPQRTDRSAREERRAPKVESLALVGTMSYEKGCFAFFDGSDSSFRKVLKTGDSIAGFTVREITSTGVHLDRDGSSVTLSVNAELRREDEGEWQPRERSATFASRSSGGERDSRDRRSRRGDESRGSSGESGAAAGSSASAGASSAAPAAADGDVSEVLKRLMEQREKELK